MPQVAHTKPIRRRSPVPAAEPELATLDALSAAASQISNLHDSESQRSRQQMLRPVSAVLPELELMRPRRGAASRWEQTRVSRLVGPLDAANRVERVGDRAPP